MFSPDIVASDAFLEMPTSTRELYFQLGMYADDDGFVSPKKIMRMVGASDDDLKVLLTKRFLLNFQSGVVVIKHWLIHNLIRADLYKETLYKTEKQTLGLNESGAYTELREGVNEIKQVEAPKWLQIRRKVTNRKRTANVPQTALRIGKDRLGKVSEGKIKDTAKKSSSSIEEPFVWKDYIKKLEDDKRRGLQVIGFYIKEKNINCDNRGEAQATVRRYLKVASQIQHFSDDKIVEATEKVKKDYPDMWTLETIYKQLTK